MQSNLAHDKEKKQNLCGTGQPKAHLKHPATAICQKYAIHTMKTSPQEISTLPALGMHEFIPL